MGQKIWDLDAARKGERPVVARRVCYPSAPCITGNILIRKQQATSKSRRRRFVVELSPTTPEPEPSIEEVAALLRQPIEDVARVIRQIKETKVLDGNSRFTREINFNNKPPALDEALLTTLNNSFEHECMEEAVALLGATSRPEAPADQIRGTKYLLEPFPSVAFLAHQI